MAMVLEKQYFDLEYFMQSTDAGCYHIAKEIFSYMDPIDLKNLMEIGKKNKTFFEFLKKEEDFLWNKFHEVKLELKRKTWMCDPWCVNYVEEMLNSRTDTQKALEDTYRVYVRAAMASTRNCLTFFSCLKGSEGL